MNDKDSFDWCRARARKGVWLDIGAHVGNYTRAMSTLTDWVYAFEASPDTAGLLQTHCADLSNVTVVHAAVAHTQGTAELYIEQKSGPTSEGNTINPFKAESGRFGHTLTNWVSVPAMSIDYWAQTNNVTNITLAKIDVEGAEQWVIAGMLETLKSNTMLITMEQHQMIDTGLIQDLVNSAGYKITRDGSTECRMTIDVPGTGYIIVPR
jgi:FkbM family methyltransferase